MQPDPKCLIVHYKEAARLVGVSIAHIRRLRQDGSGPRFVRLGKRRLGYRISDLEAWLESRAS